MPYPPIGHFYYVSSNSSSINNTVKELFVKYYRSNNTMTELRAINIAMLYLQSGSSIILNADYDYLALGMVNNLTGTIDIGDTYTFIDDNIEYTFNFFIGYPDDSGYQRMFFANYTASNATSTNNTTEEPDVNITEPNTNNITGGA